MEIFNPLPQLLDFRIFAPTILRLALALLFIYAGYRHWKMREETAKIVFPVVGQGEWVAWVAAAFHAAVGLMLFFGYYTQIAALLGILGSLKAFFFARKYPAVFFFSRSTYVLILAICLSLMLSGAGRLAFDLPL
ncbi:MAG TPA: DoxX family membrane protein [Candidatus Paceibacterota bacterium]|nr:DoxX family membrane protein [Candidatus Paceibacterota bacterium]